MAPLHPPGPPDDPHRDQPIETAGAPPGAAEAAVIMLHGRGSTAKSILTLVDELHHHGVLYLAPQAAGSSWYPGSEASRDEGSWLASALDRVASALAEAGDVGVPPERTLLFGFSQGATLASEFVARNPRRYGGFVALSGGLLEPADRELEGSLDGTPAFLGCGDDDPAVPAERVRESARAFEALGGGVTVRLYGGLGHAINDDEMRALDALVGRLV